MTVDPYEFVKQSRGRCYVRSVQIGDRFVPKAFCIRCPQCGKKLLGMLATDGSEVCLEKDCDYERQVYSPDELG